MNCAVLVVEDDASQRELIARILRRMGVRRTLGVPDGGSALRAVEEFDPTVIVMDVHLGGVDGFDGFDVLAELSERDPGLAHREVVVLTGDTEPEVRSRLLAAGARAVVHKPYRIDQLVAAVEPLLDRTIDQSTAQHHDAEHSQPPIGNGDDGAVRQLPTDARLVDVVRDLASARDLHEIASVVRTAARRLTGADGATFVLRDGEQCHYLDEDAIAPLWKGRRFPLDACISGWAMLNRQAAVIEDIYNDDRIPHDAYRPTFVRSLVMVPVRTHEPVAAIGNYWAAPRQPTQAEVQLLQTLADSTALAMQNAHLYAQLDTVHEPSSALTTSNDELRNFVYAVAHDVRTPLSTIQGFADLIATDADPDPDEVRDAIHAIRASAHSLANYVSDLLEFATADARDLDAELVALADVVEEVTERLADTISRSDATIHVDGSPHLVADRALLGQALQNMIANAISYMPAGKAPVIKIAARTDDFGWELTIADNGAGIPDGERDAVFELFRRGSTGANQTGTGIGLALCRRVAERHGGTISVRESSAGGAEFVVRLGQPAST